MFGGSNAILRLRAGIDLVHDQEPKSAPTSRTVLRPLTRMDFTFGGRMRRQCFAQKVPSDAPFAAQTTEARVSPDLL